MEVVFGPISLLASTEMDVFAQIMFELCEHRLKKKHVYWDCKQGLGSQQSQALVNNPDR